MKAGTNKITVLVPEHEFRRFEEYCKAKGFKKSTLIARLIRDHLDREGRELPRKEASEKLSRRKARLA
jgi:hypothetical protein